jgi:hypothetical protein
MGSLRVLSIIVLLLGTLAFGEEALPSVHQIYQTVQAGQLDKAHSMIDQVLKAHPNSAKAHFVDAEILARQGDMAAAKAELATAEKLDPALSFAKPKTVAELKAHLNKGNYSEKKGSSDQQVGSGSEEEKPFPWMMLVIVVGAVAVIVMLFKSRSNNASSAGGYSPVQRNPNGVSPYNNSMANNGYPQPQPTGGGLGSTIMGGLAGGVAAGAGIVAGEALMHHFIDDDKEPSHSENNSSYTPEPETASWSDDSDFGVSDGDSWGDSGGDSGDDSW